MKSPKYEYLVVFRDDSGEEVSEQTVFATNASKALGIARSTSKAGEYPTAVYMQGYKMWGEPCFL